VKLHLAHAGSRYAITAYGDRYVAVNGVQYQRSLVVLPDRVVEDWSVPDPAALTLERMETLAGLGVEIVLLGTGSRLVFPPPKLMAPMAAARVGFEVMDTRAACRTYNILMAEGRQVAAALIL